MLKRKSTSAAIPFGQLAKHCSQLINAKNFHQEELFYFTRLCIGICREPLTPEEQYIQLQAEFHRVELAKLNKAINELEQAA